MHRLYIFTSQALQLLKFLTFLFMNYTEIRSVINSLTNSDKDVLFQVTLQNLFTSTPYRDSF
jgi:hypothetical protein